MVQITTKLPEHNFHLYDHPAWSHDGQKIALMVHDTKADNTSTIWIYYPGSGRIILCSDGIIEASNAAGELFGFERIAELLKMGSERGLGAQDLIDFVFGEVGSHFYEV